MNIIGKCPNCGCPIYQEEHWGGSSPAPAIYICKCYQEKDEEPLFGDRLRDAIRVFCMPLIKE